MQEPPDALGVGADLELLFEVEAIAGAGGAGRVYRARERATGRRVALKLVLAGSARPIEEGRGARSTLEAELLAELSHPGIVAHVAHGISGAAAWLTMEWLDGPLLADRLIQAPLDARAAYLLGARVADALAAAHARGIVHRDVKPANLVLVGGGVEDVKLIDFGIACRAGQAATASSPVQAGEGTAGYMSPEQVRGERLDGSTDVFSLGCVLYRALVGHPPFGAEDPVVAALKLCLEEPERLRDTRPEVATEVDDLIARMLAKQPALRPSAAEVATVLGRVAHEASAPAPHVELGARGVGDAERRHASVVVARLAGTDAAAQLRACAAAHGAQATLLAGGMAALAFELSGNARDRAVAAARCALALRDLGVCSAVVTGRGPPHARLPLGAALERGVRLLEASPAEARAWVDPITAELVADELELCPGTDGSTLERARPAAPVRHLLGRETPCVGRAQELHQLEAAWDACVSSRVPQVVLVTGPAGIGKSRLRYELLRRLEARTPRPEVWLARGDPLRARSPFGLAAQLLRCASGAEAGEPPTTQQRKIEARIALALGPERARRAAAFLSELCGVPMSSAAHPELGAARADPLLMGDWIQRAWLDWSSADAAPRLVVLEDFHWGDAPSVSLLERTLARAVPLCILALARSDGATLEPEPWRRHPRIRIHLGALGREACLELADHVAGAHPRALHAVARVVDLCAGNPLYLEELLRAAAEGKEEIPESLLAVLEARLAALDPALRRVLRAASTMGPTFWRGAAAALCPDEAPSSIARALDELGRLELVTPRRASRFPGDLELTFRHALLREAAYATISESDRRVAHALAAAWLERVGEPDAALLAEHHELGGDAARAAACYQRAAEQALEGNDLAGALLRAERGASLVEEAMRKAERAPRLDETLGGLRLVQAEARRWRGENVEALACASSALERLPRGRRWYAAFGEAVLASGKLDLVDRVEALASELPEVPLPIEAADWITAATRASLWLLLAGRRATAKLLLERARTIAGDMAPDPGVRGRLLALEADWALTDGDLVGCLRASTAAAGAFTQAGNERNACVERARVAFAHLELGNAAEAEREAREALAVAEALQLVQPAATARLRLGLALARRGALDEACEVLERAIVEYGGQGEARMEAACRAGLAEVLLTAGRLDQAESEARAAVIGASVPAQRARGLATLADVLLAGGRKHDALVAAAEAMAILQETGGIDGREALVHLVHARALAACGRREEARRAARAARDRLLERATAIAPPEVRERFLREVPENARTLELDVDG